LADATDLGLSRMATASQGVARDQLVWTQDAYIRTAGGDINARYGVDKRIAAVASPHPRFDCPHWRRR